MGELIILINLLNSSKFRTTQMLDLLLGTGTQMRRLYDGIADARIMTDEDALEQIEELEASVTILATVKSKLKERLSESLLLIDFTDTSANDRQKAYLNCTKKWAAAQVMFFKNQRVLAIQRLENLLKYTRRFEFTELSIEILRELSLHTGSLFGDEERYKEYFGMMEEYRQLRNCEDQVESFYTELVIGFVNSKSQKRELAEKARRFFTQVEPKMAACQSFRFQLFSRLIQIAIYDNNNDHAMLIRLCADALAFFEKKPYKSHSALQVFYYSLLMGHLNLRQYEECRAIALQYRNLFQKGSYNWFKWHELHLMCELHAGMYESAAEIWQQVNVQLGSADVPQHIKETWMIFEAFLHFLSLGGLLSDRKLSKKFRIIKTLNDIHLANRDKSGMNIPLLILRFVFPLVERDYGQCVDREEGLAKYRTRYLKPEDAARSHYFFKMLELIPRSSFDPETIINSARPHLEKLKTIPIEAANQNLEVEVIPYETLWDILVGLLQNASVMRVSA